MAVKTKWGHDHDKNKRLQNHGWNFIIIIAAIWQLVSYLEAGEKGNVLK